jgi:hypothetical protein
MFSKEYYDSVAKCADFHKKNNIIFDMVNTNSEIVRSIKLNKPYGVIIDINRKSKHSVVNIPG